jgi:hypothetical protein
MVKLEAARRLAPLAGFLALALLAYATALDGWFMSDDAMIGFVIPDGKHVAWAHVGKTFHGDWRGFAGVEVMYFRPLVVVTFALDALVHALDASGYHVTNVLLHGVNAFLVSVLAERLGASRFAALFAGALFALHPLHPESVVWIAGRTDLVCAAPALGALIAHLGYRQTGRTRWLAGFAILHALALLAKENAIALPLMLIALDALRPGYARRKSPLGWLGPWAISGALCACYLAWRQIALGDVFGGRARELMATETTLETLRRYLLSNLEFFLFPVNRELAGRAAAPFQIAGALAVAALAAAALAASSNRRVPWRSVLAAVAGFFASFAPFAAGVHVQPNLNGSRMMYLPFVWLCVALGLLVVGRVEASVARTLVIQRADAGARARAGAWVARAAAWGVLGHHLVVLKFNQGPWIDAGHTIARIRDVYVESFGAYAGEQVEGMPTIDRGAYLAFWNASGFVPPFVQQPPRFDTQARLRIIYEPRGRTARVEEDPAFGATERLERALRSGVWVWDRARPPLEGASLEGCGPSAGRPGSLVATSAEPRIVIETRGAPLPAKTGPQRETVYALIRPAPRALPKFFWVYAKSQGFIEARSIELRPDLVVTGSGVEPRQLDGFLVYSARLDGHRRWRGIERLQVARLEPKLGPGALAIELFNVVRER